MLHQSLYFLLSIPWGFDDSSLPHSACPQLFHMWKRMTSFKKAVKNEIPTPEFTVANGYRLLPEWEAWVEDQGRRAIRKKDVLYRGKKVDAMKIA